MGGGRVLGVIDNAKVHESNIGRHAATGVFDQPFSMGSPREVNPVANMCPGQLPLFAPGSPRSRAASEASRGFLFGKAKLRPPACWPFTSQGGSGSRPIRRGQARGEPGPPRAPVSLVRLPG